METKISGVYKITNNITGDFYIGSSKNIERRWANHKCPYTWKICPNNPLYLNFQKYGLENFKFEIIEETSQLKEREQYFIDLLKPTYNNNRAKDLDIERRKKCQKEYHKEYRLSDKYKCSYRKANKKYKSQLCLYKGKTLTLNALSIRFQKQGIPHSTLEAKKYLLEE